MQAVESAEGDLNPEVIAKWREACLEMLKEKSVLALATTMPPPRPRSGALGATPARTSELTPAMQGVALFSTPSTGMIGLVVVLDTFSHQRCGCHLCVCVWGGGGG